MPRYNIFHANPQVRNDLLKIHLPAWLFLFISFFINFYTADEAKDSERLRNALIFTILNLPNIPITYLLALFVFPRTLNNQELSLWSSLPLLFAAIITLALADGWFFAKASQVIAENSVNLQDKHERLSILRNVPEAIYSMGVFTSVIYLRAWYRRSKELEKLRLRQDQLNRLHTDQHSLLNMLNRVYNKAFKNRDTVTEELHILTGLLRYLVYSVKTPTVTLQEEAQMLHRYVQLKRKGYNRNVKIITRIIVSEESKDRIAPMLLLPVLENAFKHGADQTIDRCQIRVSLTQPQPGHILFICKNTKPNKPPESIIDSNKQPTGVGLEITRQRLDSHYANLYTLDIESEHPEYYQVQLKINLKP